MSARKDRIVDLAKAGVPRALIAEATGAALYTVYWTVCQARKRGEDIPRGKGGGRPRGASFRLPPETVRALEIDAAMRGLTPAELAAEIVQVCARDRLVGAILDDGEAGDV